MEWLQCSKQFRRVPKGTKFSCLTLGLFHVFFLSQILFRNGKYTSELVKFNLAPLAKSTRDHFPDKLPASKTLFSPF